jgi:translation initiation factor IF-2
MEQRRPRLGDIVDDYCPRERRLANHVVVAMIGEEIKQTRCTTCDAEHVYKHAKVPPRRKKAETPAALVKQVADALAEKPRLSIDTLAAEDAPASPAPGPAGPAALPVPEAPVTPLSPEPPGLLAAQEPVPAERAEDEGPVHRALIRATLPRVPGEERETRPIPEFTMQAVRNARAFRNQRHGGKGGNRPPKGRAAAANFRPGVMGAWSPSNPRPRAGGPAAGNRPPQHPRPQGRKKPR